MPFLRFTRDGRGYENTFLLHVAHFGERPRILYWYRSAPGVRVGRPALDEDAIRTIEEQHPEVDFDWPAILEVGAATPPEIEDRPLRPRPKPAKPPRREREERFAPPPPVTTAAPDDTALTSPLADEIEEAVEPEEEAAEPKMRAHDLLEELVGREIATRLRARYAEVVARIHRLPENHPQRDAWQSRADALNPDNWVTPDEVLSGVQRADQLFDALRRELVAHQGAVH